MTDKADDATEKILKDKKEDNFLIKGYNYVSDFLSFLHITRRDIIILLVGMFIMGGIAFHVYEWRINEAKINGSITIYEPVVIKDAKGVERTVNKGIKYSLVVAPQEVGISK